jgi:hypothetical protein
MHIHRIFNLHKKKRDTSTTGSAANAPFSYQRRSAAGFFDF